MRYRTLGRSGLRVSELCLGTMTFGEDWGWGASEAESRRMFDLFVERGGNFFDTANSYTGGTSERFLGAFIAADRDRYVVATKYTHANRLGDVNGSGNHRKNLIPSVEASLQRLGTGYLDLLWLHAWDFLTPVEEVMRSLDDLVSAGKVRYLGISDTPAWVVSQANTLAVLRGWTPFIGLQVEYSLLQRTAERDLLPMAQALSLGVTTWGPLGAGLLSGKYLPGVPDADTGRIGVAPAFYGGLLTERNLSIAQEVRHIANTVGQSPAAVALNWIRQQPGSPIPILGTRTVPQLMENLGCLDFALDEAPLQRLNALSQFERGFPHDFLASDAVRFMVYGNTHTHLDFPR
jgi:aryl-alcohol dehydrogenase-like predicted oxidoreductase